MTAAVANHLASVGLLDHLPELARLVRGVMEGPPPNG